MLLMVSLFAGCAQNAPPTEDTAPASKITYSEHVAAIIDQRCTSCHYDSGAAPFSLTEYEQVAERATQIVEVVRSGYMPPWLPGDSDHAFHGDRRLTDEERNQLETWLAQDTPEGDPALRPTPPLRTNEWALGEPDLIVSMTAPYTRDPEEHDRWRNFVLPVNTDKTQYVEAVDIDAGNPKAVHHAVLQLDAARRSRTLDASDPEDGFAGMRDGVLSLGPYAKNPDGHFLGWTPGKVPYRRQDGLAWKLPTDSDLILQLHMPATGKPEEVQSRVGLYFADQPPKQFPFCILLSARSIDIPPGQSNYQIKLEYRIPVACDLLSVYPHAHYLCRSMRVTVTPPEAAPQLVLNIPDWNFDWQDEYRFAEPVSLPANSLIQMTYEFDNSEHNPRNPYQPPARVVYGEQSTDEMADLVLQVLPDNESDRRILAEDFLRYQYQESLQHHLWALQQGHPAGRHHNGAGEAYLLLNEPARALPHLQAAAKQQDSQESPGHLYAKMAMAYARLQQHKLAADNARRAAAESPDSAEIQYQMGILLQTAGQVEAAIACYQRAIQLNADDVASRINLGILWGQTGKVHDSIGVLREAVERQPGNAIAHLNLGISLRADGQQQAAINAFEKAVELAPGNDAARVQLQRTQTNP